METLTTTNLTTEQAAAIGSAIGAFLGVAIVACLAYYILQVIANWRIFEKAGEKGWKSLIPIYSTFIMFKIVNMENWFWGLLIISIVGSLVLSLNGYELYAVTEEAIAARRESMNNPIVVIVSIAMAVISIWAYVLYAIRTAKVFGKSGWFAAGLLFLTPIFWLILAFGKAKYNKKNLKK